MSEPLEREALQAFVAGTAGAEKGLHEGDLVHRQTGQLWRSIGGNLFSNPPALGGSRSVTHPGQCQMAVERPCLAGKTDWFQGTIDAARQFGEASRVTQSHPDDT